jgi:predicted ester cyclase
MFGRIWTSVSSASSGSGHDLEANHFSLRFRPVLVSPKTLVERFYFEVWNRANEAAAREILHPEFRFRASLGPERPGPEGFIDYMRSIHAAVADYSCMIDNLIVTDDRAAARMKFKGLHRGRFFEVEPTGREIRWAGGTLFSTVGRRNCRALGSRRPRQREPAIERAEAGRLCFGLAS